MKITSRRRRFHRRLAFPLAPAPPPQAHILTGRPHARSESHPSALSRLSRCLPGAAGADPSHTKAHCAGSSAGRHCGRPVRLCLWRGGGECKRGCDRRRHSCRTHTGVRQRSSRRRRLHRRLAFPLAPPRPLPSTGTNAWTARTPPGRRAGAVRLGVSPCDSDRAFGRPIPLCLWRGGGRRQEGMRVQAAQLPHAYRRGEARVARGADAPLSRAPTGLNTRARAHALTHTHYLSLQCRNESQQAATSCSITNRPLLTHWASALRKRGAARRIPPGPAFFSS